MVAVSLGRLTIWASELGVLSEVVERIETFGDCRVL